MTSLNFFPPHEGPQSGGHGMYYTAVHARITGLIQTIQALSILNILLCSIVVGTVIFYARKHDMIDRVSFRLSASIAIADTLYSIIQLIVNDEKFTDKLSEMQLRTLFFFHLSSYNVLVFTTACIAFHLHLTALLNKQKLARKFSPWYELISWSISIIIAHPMFYVYNRCLKIKGLNIIIMADYSLVRIRIIVWLMYGWCAMALLYCLFVCILVIVRLMPVWKQVNCNVLMLPEGGRENIASDTDVSLADKRKSSTEHPNYITSSQLLGNSKNGHSISERRRREVRFAVVRIALYSIIPFITSPIMPAYLSIVNPSIILANVTIILPNLGGLLNFIIFMINPHLDPAWRTIKRKAKQLITKYKTGNHNLSLFASPPSAPFDSRIWKAKSFNTTNSSSSGSDTHGNSSNRGSGNRSAFNSSSGTPDKVSFAEVPIADNDSTKERVLI
ncbi:hypothetical protein H4219_002459 [Mycoemilia scoparia]|uniref:Uncharacterized protein n=1 Tax=Mycoemilia scoparia TaxID=417184 RepID=A0A9W8A2F2_9FUNG|nr:hypothetical protein H4219_002459 [Mycoemilia scoparia]